MELPSAKDLDVTSEDMDNCPPGTTLSIMPPCREYMADPMWFDQIGRDPIHRRKIFQRSARGEITRDDLKTELSGILDEWPRYGPAVFSKAAKEGRADVVEVLIEMGVESDPKTMKNQNGDEDEDDEPLLEVEHAYLSAIFEKRLDIVELLVERGGVPVNYEDADDGFIHVAYSLPNVEILRWLLDHGATITLVRDGNGCNDLQSAMQRGSQECLEILLSHPQVGAAGRQIELGDLGFAVMSAKSEMVRYVLQSDCFRIQDPDVGLAGEKLDQNQQDAIIESINVATGRGTTELVRLLLKQLTPVRPDGSFEPFVISDEAKSGIFNQTDEALDLMDNPELFELLWDTILHQSPSQESIDNYVGLPPRESLNRRLISTAAMGRVKTVKLLIERYGADVNHISHKYCSTPLGRAAVSGANPLPGRLEVVEYLCSRPDLNMELAYGEFCNGKTALTLAVQQASMSATLTEMVRLLLQLGGPVDEVSADLRALADSWTSSEAIKVYVLWADAQPREPVVLSTEEREGYTSVVLEYSARELRLMLRNVKIRSDDETLRTSDPRGRPLMPRESEATPEVEMKDA